MYEYTDYAEHLQATPELALSMQLFGAAQAHVAESLLDGGTSAVVLGPSVGRYSDYDRRFYIHGSWEANMDVAQPPYYAIHYDRQPGRDIIVGSLKIPEAIQVQYGEVARIVEPGSDFDGIPGEALSTAELEIFVRQIADGHRLTNNEVADNGKIYNPQSLRYAAHMVLGPLIARAYGAHARRFVLDKE
jgi:hypothetical protein